MQRDEFMQWLSSLPGITHPRVPRDYVSRASRVERELGVDLDVEYEQDRCAALLRSLEYTRDDQQKQHAPRVQIEFNTGNHYDGLASLRTSVSKYLEFRQSVQVSQERNSNILGQDTGSIEAIHIASQESLSASQVEATKGRGAMILTATQIRLAEQLLISVKNRESVVEYNELASRIDPPIFWRQVGKEIGEVSKLCKELGLPLISAKVVSRGSGKAGAGFFDLMKKLGMDTHGKTEKELFLLELKKIRECTEWYRLEDYLGLNVGFPRPARSASHTDIAPDFTPERSRVDAPDSSRRCWIIPASENTYDVIGAFKRFTVIDWRQSVNYRIDDTVYIYCSKPQQRIMFETIVIATDISFSESIDDSEFWVDPTAHKGLENRLFSRLRLLKSVQTDLLSLAELLKRGLRQAPQGPMNPSLELERYIAEAFNLTQDERIMNPEISPLAEELVLVPGQTFYEGARKQITVNAYERNPAARNECIRVHGSVCTICGFDFGQRYGVEFEGKIHVHHVRPIHLIDDEYEINPHKDLVPVCPNCHLVIHSKPQGVYSVTEVKAMLLKEETKRSKS